jgi:hypothetical protein
LPPRHYAIFIAYAELLPAIIFFAIVDAIISWLIAAITLPPIFIDISFSRRLFSPADSERRFTPLLLPHSLPPHFHFQPDELTAAIISA